MSPRLCLAGGSLATVSAVSLPASLVLALGLPVPRVYPSPGYAWDAVVPVPRAAAGIPGPLIHSGLWLTRSRPSGELQDLSVESRVRQHQEMATERGLDLASRLILGAFYICFRTGPVRIGPGAKFDRKVHEIRLNRASPLRKPREHRRGFYVDSHDRRLACDRGCPSL
jgi:hypothetical protein